MPARSHRPRSLEDEALRLNARYLEEVVIGWNLCPWAARAWREGQVARRVFIEPSPRPETLLGFLDELTDRPAVAVGLAIFPQATADEAAWGRFAERARRADRARLPAVGRAPFLLAAFHPAGGVSGASTAGELVACIRRTPDPTVQLVRTSAIDAVAETGRDVSKRISEENYAQIRARGVGGLTALLEEIRRDRDATYAALGAGQAST